MLLLERFAFGERATIGVLRYMDRPLMFTLEDEDRTAVGLPKMPGKTCIPAGSYTIDIKAWSPTFKRAVPEVHGVPGFTDILFHPGNYPEDTRGCVLPGEGADLRRWMVTNSTKAFARLFSLVNNGETWRLNVTRIGPSRKETEALKRVWTAQYIREV